MKVPRSGSGATVILVVLFLLPAAAAAAVDGEEVAALVDRAEQVSAVPLDRYALSEVFGQVGAEEAERIIATGLVAHTSSATVTVPLDAGARRTAATVGAPTAVSPLATGCWRSQGTWETRSASGGLLYTYSTTGRWCASGSSVTSAALEDADGSAVGSGWSYGGVRASGSGVRDGQGRSYAKHAFTLIQGGHVISTPTPCGRVNGLSNGTASLTTDCGLG